MDLNRADKTSPDMDKHKAPDTRRLLSLEDSSESEKKEEEESEWGCCSQWKHVHYR